MNTRLSNSNRAAFTAPAMLALILAHGTVVQAAGTAIAPAAQTAHNPAVSPPAQDIRDIRGPLPIASPWSSWLIAATVLTALGGAYAAWAWNRGRFREASKQPLSIALERLDKARSLMVAQRGREFSIEVSSAVRDFIESRFDLRAAHLTTDEFLRQVLEPVDSPLAAHRALLDDFLQTCDLAKFGGWNLAAADMQAMMQGARRFIVESAGTSALHTASATRAHFDQRPTSTSRETYVSLPST